MKKILIMLWAIIALTACNSDTPPLEASGGINFNTGGNFATGGTTSTPTGGVTNSTGGTTTNPGGNPATGGTTATGGQTFVAPVLCASPFANCKTGAVECETNLAVDNANCGACGRSCPAESACINGNCIGNCRPANEVCNGRDDDCNGQKDEGYLTGGECSNGLKGSCLRFGQLVCNAQGGVSCNAEIGFPTPEICNGKDEDCDGTADNGLPFCGKENATEKCDGRDNDGDGDTDEGFNSGTSCSAGLPNSACFQLGVIKCQPDGTAACNAVAKPGVPEICDGVDNDCDGEADEGLENCIKVTQPEICNGRDDDGDGLPDEGYGVSESCSAGLANSACFSLGIKICDTKIGSPTFGQSVCNAVAGTPKPEVCDGNDNDCNGTADDGLPLCGKEDKPELCDGRDNNGNGFVDELYNVGQLCSTGKPGTGCFQPGIILCQPNGTAACSAIPKSPSAEICDGVDNDCDEIADDGLDCSFLPEPEICDGRDNDGNKQVDELFNKGQPCTVGNNGCARTGTFICTPDGKSTVCLATAGTPTPEICDGVDNDCDGVKDNGVCACVPTTEICNGVDDDCDGAEDEGFPLKNTSCTAGVGTCRREGTYICQPDGSLACNATARAAGVEVCNGLDDDCDGFTDEDGVCTIPFKAELCNGIDDDGDGQEDEDFPQKGQVCSAGIGNCQSLGRFICNGVGIVCNAIPGSPKPEVCDGTDQDCDGTADNGVTDCGLVSSAETCDGRDNDLDGLTDEPFPVYQVCSAGRPNSACYAVSTFLCDTRVGSATFGQAYCPAVAGTPRNEICNGIDDDCDGIADDGLSCACSSETESCDGRDNDCDGQADEGFFTNTTCFAGTGVCRRSGFMVCNGSGSFTTICNAVPTPAGVEICRDFLDNDCDGQTDELPCN